MNFEQTCERGRAWAGERTSTALLSMCVAVAVLVVSAAAQVVTTAPTPVSARPWSQERVKDVVPGSVAQKALAGLDSPLYEEREAAQREFEGESIAQKEIYALLWRKDLSAEQRARLLNVAQLRLLEAPRTIIGIQMAPDVPGRPGTVVAGVQQDVPAAEVLKRGDRIVEVEGEAITVRDQVANMVGLKSPGDELHLVVVRDTEQGPAQRVELKVKLIAMPRQSRLNEATGLPPRVDAVRQLQALQLKETFAAPTVAVPVKKVPGTSSTK